MREDHPPRRIPPALGFVVQLVAGFVVLVALLGIVELSARLLLRGGMGRRSTMAGLRDSVSHSQLNADLRPTPTIQDVRLLWRNRPLATQTQAINPRPYGRDESWSIRINSEGHRGPERTANDLTEDVYRILFVGDSVTFGFNVDEDETFVRRVEAALQKAFPRRRFDVIDAAVPGWSWVQGARFVVDEGLALRPDLIVAAHGINDQFWPARITDREHMWLNEQALLGTLERANNALLQTAAYRLIAFAYARHARVQMSPGCEAQAYQGTGCKRVSVSEIERTVHALHDVTRAAGVDLLVANLDFYQTDAVHGLRARSLNEVRVLDYVEQFTKQRLSAQIEEATERGLARPHLPLVRIGTIEDPAPENRGPRILFRMTPVRQASRVVLRGRALGQADEIAEPMYDDATHGDEKAGDGVHSVTIEMQPNGSQIGYQYEMDGIPEFEMLPPLESRSLPRVMRCNRDGTAPIERFGDLYFMADMVHPDAGGSQLIAFALMKEIYGIPSLRRFTRRFQ